MRKIFFLLIMCLCSMTMFSCKDKNDDDNQIENDILKPSEIDKSKETVVTFYHAMGQSNSIPSTLDNIANAYENEMLAKYGAKISVKFENFGDYETLKNEISNGNHPTIAQTKPDHVATYLKEVAVSSLNKYIEHSEYGLEGNKEDSYGYFDNFFDEGSIYDNKGTIYSIPFNKSTEVLFYNKNLFDKYEWKVPATWDDVIEISELWKLTTEYQNAKDIGKKVGGIGIDSEANFFITLIKQWGCEYTAFNSNGEGEYRFNNPKAKAALQWLVDEFNRGNTVTATYLGTNYCSDAFKAMQLPMTIGSSAGASYNVVTDGSFVTGVAPYPQMAGATEEEKQVIQQGTNVTLFECADKQEELFGWLFMKYLTNYESSLEWSLRTAYFPIRKDVAASDEYQKYISQIIYDEKGNPQLDENGEPVKEYEVIKETYKIILSQVDYLCVPPTFYNSTSKGEFIIQAILYNQKEYDAERAIKEALDELNNN